MNLALFSHVTLSIWAFVPVVTRCSSIIPTWKTRRGQRQPISIGDCRDQSFPRKPQQTSAYVNFVRSSHVAILSCKEGWERSEIITSVCCSCWNSPVKCCPSLRTTSDSLCQVKIPAAQLCLPLPTLGRSQHINGKLFTSVTSSWLRQPGRFLPTYFSCLPC